MYTLSLFVYVSVYTIIIRILNTSSRGLVLASLLGALLLHLMQLTRLSNLHLVEFIAAFVSVLLLLLDGWYGSSAIHPASLSCTSQVGGSYIVY